jgi:hypothetical protein
MILWRIFGACSSCPMITTRARYPYATYGASPKSSGTDWRTTSCTFFLDLFFCVLADTIPLPPPVRQAMIDEFDLNQDGEINEQEFSACRA